MVAEGELDASFFVIVEGSVAVKKNTRDILLLHPGACFGEMGLVSGRQRSATVVALMAVTLLKICSPLIERMPMSTQNRFQRNFLLALISRLETATEQLADQPPSHEHT